MLAVRRHSLCEVFLSSVPRSEPFHTRPPRSAASGMVREASLAMSRSTLGLRTRQPSVWFDNCADKDDGHNKPKPREGRKPLPEPTEYMCLMRASLRNKKISTVIHPKDVNKFQQAYSNLLKGNLDGLKKLKKSKAKPKATQ